MSKLLRRAKVKLENAKNSYRYISDDDAYLDDDRYVELLKVDETVKFQHKVVWNELVSKGV